MNDHIEALIEEVGDYFGNPDFLGEFTEAEVARFAELYAAARNQRNKENKNRGRD